MDARTRRVTAPPATTQSDYRRRGSPAARAEEPGCLINDDYWSLSQARPACGPGRDRPELGRPIRIEAVDKRKSSSRDVCKT